MSPSQLYDIPEAPTIDINSIDDNYFSTPEHLDFVKEFGDPAKPEFWTLQSETGPATQAGTIQSTEGTLTHSQALGQSASSEVWSQAQIESICAKSFSETAAQWSSRLRGFAASRGVYIEDGLRPNWGKTVPRSLLQESIGMACGEPQVQDTIIAIIKECEEATTEDDWVCRRLSAPGGNAPNGVHRLGSDCNGRGEPLADEDRKEFVPKTASTGPA